MLWVVSFSLKIRVTLLFYLAAWGRMPNHSILSPLDLHSPGWLMGEDPGLSLFSLLNPSLERFGAPLWGKRKGVWHQNLFWFITFNPISDMFSSSWALFPKHCLALCFCTLSSHCPCFLFGPRLTLRVLRWLNPSHVRAYINFIARICCMRYVLSLTAITLNY